jgi:hypothetical protein
MDSNIVPFILLHQTGFSKLFVRSIIQQTSQGMTLSAIGRYIKKMREGYGTAILLQAKHKLVKHHVSEEGINPLSSPILNQYPSE